MMASMMAAVVMAMLCMRQAVLRTSTATGFLVSLQQLLISTWDVKMVRSALEQVVVVD